MIKGVKCLCLAGPTASGKTAAALKLAESLPIEIISVDSALIYKGMDIGTAKPTPQELNQAPHHLIDIIDPTQTYSVARFVEDTHQLIQDIDGRHKTPVLVGGTMMYFKALLEGMDELPLASPDVRQQIDEEAQVKGWPALHVQLMQVDPITATRLQPTDAQRIQRALEVWRSTGKPMSSFHSDPERGLNRGLEQQSGIEWTVLALEPNNRAWLHERIAQRFHTMMDQGFLDEVRQLKARGDLHADMPSMRCVGYRQAWEHLESQLSLDEMVERGIIATRQLGKRQLTWLRSMDYRHSIACDQPDALSQVVEVASGLLQT